MSKLNEAQRALSNPKILKYVDECIQDLRDFCIMPANWGDDIDVLEMDTTRKYGTMAAPKREGSNHTLYLSKHMYDEDEKVIKNTIFHELAHYIQYKKALAQGVYKLTSRGLIWGIPSYERAAWTAHGRVWREIADQIQRFTGQKINRTDTYDSHKEVGKVAADRTKYIFKCSRCGAEFKFQKRTEFVKHALETNGHTTRWWCRCGCHVFDIIKKED